VGWELTYEITGDPEQYKFAKAKAINPNNIPSPKGITEQTLSYDKPQVPGVTIGAAMNKAVDYCIAKDKPLLDAQDYAEEIVKMHIALDEKFNG